MPETEMIFDWATGTIYWVLLTWPDHSTGASLCKTLGHCDHEGTAVGSWWCCRCHRYVRFEGAWNDKK